MNSKEIEELLKQIKTTDLSLIASFLNENFVAFSSFCNERAPDTDADHIVSTLEKL